MQTTRTKIRQEKPKMLALGSDSKVPARESMFASQIIIGVMEARQIRSSLPLQVAAALAELTSMDLASKYKPQEASLRRPNQTFSKVMDKKFPNNRHFPLGRSSLNLMHSRF